MTSPQRHREEYKIIFYNAKIPLCLCGERPPNLLKPSLGSSDSPTENSEEPIDVFATEDAIYRVQNATDPLAAYKSAEKSGQVRIEGRTLGARLKLGAALSSGEVIKSFFGILS
jgi:hypothetical protein